MLMLMKLVCGIWFTICWKISLNHLISLTMIDLFFWMPAKALANLASSHSADKTFESPYSLEARSKVKSLASSNTRDVSVCTFSICFLTMDGLCFFTLNSHRGMMFLSGKKYWE